MLDRANVKELEKLAIAFASLGDIPTCITYLREIWKLEPHHVFHNDLPMVKVMDLYEEMASLAEVEGGKDALNKMNKVRRVLNFVRKMEKSEIRTR